MTLPGRWFDVTKTPTRGPLGRVPGAFCESGNHPRMLRFILLAVAATVALTACSLRPVGRVPGRGSRILSRPATPTGMRKVTLDIPGSPARILPADVNGDGRTDLVMALAWSEFESVEFERLEGFVQMTTIVPALFDRREMRVYLQQPDGQYLMAGPPLPLPATVLALDTGPGSTPWWR